MANKRDVELLLRANDLSSRPIKDVAEAVAKLTTKLTEQESAASRGEATVRELSTTLNQLNEASKVLAQQNAAIERFRDLGTQLENAQTKADAARAALAGLTVAQEGTTQATAAQTREFNKAETAVARSVADVQKRTAALERQSQVLAQAGIGIAQLAQAEQTLIAAATETGQARNRATTALEEYDARLRAHRAEVKAAAEGERENARLTREAAEAEAELATAAAAAQARPAAARAAAANAAKTQAAEYEQWWISALGDVEQAKKEENDVRAFTDRLASARAKEAAAEYERWWIGALGDVEAKQKAVNASLAAQTTAFKANRDAVRQAFQSTIGYTQAQEDLVRRQTGYAGKPGFLGLRPYEIQNLSFQINDIFTQLSSGASVTQALSQQGGQIFQLFQSRLVGFASVLPVVAVAVAVIGTLVAAMVRLRNTAEGVKEFSARLALSADGARFAATEMVKTQRELQRLGVGFDDAGEAITRFANAGFRQGQLESLTTTAVRLGKVLKIDLKEAVGDLIEGFNGGFDSVEKLDRKYNVFSTTQLATIKNLFDEGRAIDARNFAYTTLSNRVDEAAKKLAGPLSSAFKAARASWLDFLDAIGNSAIGRNLYQALVGSALLMEAGAKALAAGVKAIAGESGVDGAISEQRKELERLNALRTQMTERNDRLKPTPEKLRQVDEAIAARTLNIEILTRTKNTRAQTAADKEATVAASSEADATEKKRKAGERFLEHQQDQIDAARGVNNARRVQLAGEKAFEAALEAGADQESARTARTKAAAEERRQIGEALRGQADSLEQQLAQITAQGDKTQRESLARRLKAIDETYASVATKLLNFARVGGRSIAGVGLDEYKARVEAQKELLKQNETLKFFEENITDLVKARATAFRDINDAVAGGAKTAGDGFREVLAVASDLNPKITKLAADALAFAQALNEVRPGPQLTEFIAQMERAQRQAGAGPRSAFGSEAEMLAKTQLDAIFAKLQTRTEIEQTWQNLVEKGVVTQGEASQNIRAAYEDINEGLDDLVSGFERFLAVAGDSLPAAKLELFRAKLAEVRSDMQQLDPAARELKNVIEQSIANNAVQAFDRVAESIGGAIAGTKTWGEAFREVGVAAAMFFADLLRDIAKAIIKAQILAAIKAITGAVFHEGGVVGMGSSQMTRTGSASSWFGAPKYHSGRAAVGMSANEVNATLLRGEEVLTRDDPRNVLNGSKNFRGGGGAGGGASGLRQVLVLDPKEVPAAMQSPTGERVVLTHIKSNAGAIRSILGL